MDFTGESLEPGNQKPRCQCMKGTDRQFPEEGIRALDNHLCKKLWRLLLLREYGWVHV